ncbi:MAG TPA: hypothetical protein VLE49_06320 [Anaerolineales bacterium]|nr:hypothetical protein [Anaerolineales bacterium]
MKKKRIYYRSFAVIVFIGFLISSCLPRPVNKPVNRNVDPSLPAPTSRLSTSVPAENDVFCERPYQDSSVWNTPIDWSIARIHPMSDLMMNAFFKNGDWIGTDTSQYTPNVYLASNSTPLVPVQLRQYRFRDAISDTVVNYGEPAGIVQMPLPSGAQPALGTDGQLVVINVDTGEEWGLNDGSIDGKGKWFAGGVYRYSIKNSGIPPEGFGQRGAGIGQLAGIVRRCEVDRGRIGHAVTLAYDYPCAPEVCQANGWPASIPPFRKTDGIGNFKFDAPEGARIAIRPEIPQEEIDKACAGIKGCIVWVQAMEEYGGFIVDKSGHPKTYAEGNPTAHWDPSVWTDDMLKNIPTDWYVVIDWNSPSTKVQ